MPVHFSILRRVPLIAAAVTVGIFASSCATKKGVSASNTPSAEKKKEEEPPKPSPTPAATPAASPTPQARYVATVKVEGGETTRQELTPDAQAAPSPTPGASPSPTPEPSPTPKSPNFLSQAWQKIFPPKATPFPTPGPTGGITVKVTTEDGRTVEQVLREGSEAPAPTIPTPEPIKLKPRGESIFSRAWHLVFPKKELPPPATLPQWIGTIKLVNERDGYALIDSQQGYFAIADGEILNAVGGGSESGVLRVTPDRNPPFFIADIVGGKPRAGDRVYSPKP